MYHPSAFVTDVIAVLYCLLLLAISSAIYSLARRSATTALARVLRNIAVLIFATGPFAVLIISPTLLSLWHTPATRHFAALLPPSRAMLDKIMSFLMYEIGCFGIIQLILAWKSKSILSYRWLAYSIGGFLAGFGREHNSWLLVIGIILIICCSIAKDKHIRRAAIT